MTIRSAPSMDVSASQEPRRVCVAAFAGPHGVRGEVHLKMFTERPEALGAFQTLYDESGARCFKLLGVRGVKKSQVVASFVGVTSREEAMTLQGKRLYVDRACLPEIEDEDEFYHADLLGCAVLTTQGAVFGTVQSLQNFGAGDLLEVRSVGSEGDLMIPFTKKAVPEVDLGRRELKIDLAFALPPEKPKEPAALEKAGGAIKGAGV